MLLLPKAPYLNASSWHFNHLNMDVLPHPTAVPATPHTYIPFQYDWSPKLLLAFHSLTRESILQELLLPYTHLSPSPVPVPFLRPPLPCSPCQFALSQHCTALHPAAGYATRSFSLAGCPDPLPRAPEHHQQALSGRFKTVHLCDDKR